MPQAGACLRGKRKSRDPSRKEKARHSVSVLNIDSVNVLNIVFLCKKTNHFVRGKIYSVYCQLKSINIQLKQRHQSIPDAIFKIKDDK